MPINVRANVKLDLRIKSVQRFVDDFRELVTEDISKKVMVKAKRNVQPRSGPGPHPHRFPSMYPPHIDTGFLRDSIDFALVAHTGATTEHAVFSDLNYPRPFNVYLEFGWVNPEFGSFTRYPWLWPAAVEVANDWMNHPGTLTRLIGKAKR